MIIPQLRIRNWLKFHYIQTNTKHLLRRHRLHQRLLIDDPFPCNIHYPQPGALQSQAPVRTAYGTSAPSAGTQGQGNLWFPTDSQRYYETPRSQGYRFDSLKAIFCTDHGYDAADILALAARAACTAPVANM